MEKALLKLSYPYIRFKGCKGNYFKAQITFHNVEIKYANKTDNYALMIQNAIKDFR
jgi:hypothetical protein